VSTALWNAVKDLGVNAALVSLANAFPTVATSVLTKPVDTFTQWPAGVEEVHETSSVVFLEHNRVLKQQSRALRRKLAGQN